MKCPKCGYLGFETVDRCRNCGYDFSLAQPEPLPDLPMRRGGDETSQAGDLALSSRAAAAPPQPSRFQAEARADLDRLFGAPPSRGGGAKAAAAPEPPPADELPLFGGPITDDVPLITKISPPRQPLSVRRATPEVPRLKADVARPAMLDLELEPPPGDHPERPAAGSRAAVDAAEPVEDASLGARFMAVALDLVLLASVDLMVIYFTMQICGLTVNDLGILPKGPLFGFLFLQNGGYLVAFTAGGQTLGKMAAGVRVVGVETGAALHLGRAALRELVWLALAAPAGLGFLTTIFSADHRGLHDRFAGTRVVRQA
ncbi:MAG TPA: RDD family protein [Vicinamibacterales bacterium]|jgi:uncharacterized RDD family membrane protein YckC|nr:RDD family protein [Vicinamibacterales bacterium]